MRHPLFALLLLTVACASPRFEEQPDATPTIDAEIKDALPIADAGSLDGTSVDAGPDATAPDAGPVDAMADAMVDAAAADAEPSPDATPVDAGFGPLATPSPTALSFGAITEGTFRDETLTIENTGDIPTTIRNITSSDPAFAVLPPIVASLEPGERAEYIVRFAPTSATLIAGTISIEHSGPTTVVAVDGEGLTDPGTPALDPEQSSIEFGRVEIGAAADVTVRLSNTGDGVARIDTSTATHPAFVVLAPLPLAIAPGQARTVTIRFSPRLAGDTRARITLDGQVGPPVVLLASGYGTEPNRFDPLDAPTFLRLPAGPNNLANQITVTTSSAVGLQVGLPTTLQPGDRVDVEVADSAGHVIRASQPTSTATTATLVVNTSTLTDGPISIYARVGRGAGPAGLRSEPRTLDVVKVPSGLQAPFVDPLPDITAMATLVVTGTAAPGALVTVEGAAGLGVHQLQPAETAFSTQVVLRRNAQNILRVCATLDGMRACAPPISVVHLVPDEFVIAEATSRRLTTEEVEALVDSGVIDLQDPDNFHVSEFTVVLEVGGVRVAVSQPVAVHAPGGRATPGVYYGANGGRGGGPGAPGGTGGGGGGGSGARVFVVQPPGGLPPIPGVIILDGAIHTLREFFQVTLALTNLSSVFHLEDVTASLVIPPGLTAIRAAVGTTVSEVEVTGPIDTVTIGTIEVATSSAGTTRAAQFILRGDVAGHHDVQVDFGGVVVGPGLSMPEPFAGSAETSVAVYGPPNLAVRISHPPSVELGEEYDVIITIQNLSPIPALYASLDFGVGAGARFASDGCNAPPRTEHYDLGHLQPSQSATRIARLVSCLRGPVTGCSIAADQNLSVSVYAGVACTTGSTVPFDLPSGFEPPIVVSAAPPPNAAIPHQLASLQVVLTGRVVNAVADQFDASGTLVSAGTARLARMNASGTQVLDTLPTTVTTQFVATSSRTTIVISPSDGLVPDAVYRATVAGGSAGVRNALSGLPLASDFTWFFRTVPVDDGVAPTVLNTIPADGASDVLAGTNVVVRFSERIDPRSLSINLNDYRAGTFALVSGATIIGGDITGGTALSGRITLDAGGTTFTYSSTPPVFPGGQFSLRIAGVRDVFGNAIAGVVISTFDSGPPDMVDPDVPRVEPIARYTAANGVLVRGSAEAYATVTVTGGAVGASGRADARGRFTVGVPLTANRDHNLSVFATDLSNNASIATSVDISGNPLTVGRDATSPSIAVSAPTPGATVVGMVDVVYTSADAFGPGVDQVRVLLDGLVVADGTAAAGTLRFNSETFVNGAHELSVWARDAVGNWSATPAVLSLTVANPLFPRIDTVVPAEMMPGASTRLRLHGANMDTITSVVFADPRIGVDGFAAQGALDLIVDATVPFDFAPVATSIAVSNPFGDASINIDVVAPTPAISSFDPARVLASASGRMITVRGTGFLPSTEVVIGQSVFAAAVVGSTELRFTLPASHLAAAGPIAVSLRTADPAVGHRFSADRAITVVVPNLGFSESAITIVPGDVREVQVTLTETAETGGYDVFVMLDDPDGTLSAPTMVTIPEGARSVNASLTAVQSGAPVMITASAPFATSGDMIVGVVPPPTPSFAESPVVTQPLLDRTYDLELDAPAPTDGLVVALGVFSGGATVPANVSFAGGEQSRMFTVTGVTPGDFTLSATTAHSRTATVALHVREAVASSAPTVIRAATLGNEVLIRVTTDGTNPIAAVRIEVPARWSTPQLSDITATLGDMTDVSTGLTRGAPGAGPNGGTTIELMLAQPVLTTDGSPWVDVLFESMSALDVLGLSHWPVEVDDGSGYAGVYGRVEVLVRGTAADGAGTVALTTVPDPLLAMSTNATVTLSLTNDVEVVTNAATIFRDWSSQGANRQWELFNHGTFGQVLRTPLNTDPGYFVSDDVLTDGTIDLQIGALTTGDDDFIGLVFRWVDTCNFYLLDWKKGNQNSGGQVATAGLALRRISNCDHDGDGTPDALSRLWGNESTRPNVLAVAQGAGQGWVSNRLHQMRVVLAGNHIEVFIDGTQKMSVDDPAGWTEGRYGPYAYSQAQTSIRDLRVLRGSATIDVIEVELPAPWQVQLTARVGALDRTSDLMVNGTSIRLEGAALLPEATFDLIMAFPAAPPAATYPIVVRTAGTGGELLPVASQPALVVQ